MESYDNDPKINFTTANGNNFLNIEVQHELDVCGYGIGVPNDRRDWHAMNGRIVYTVKATLLT